MQPLPPMFERVVRPAPLIGLVLALGLVAIAAGSRDAQVLVDAEREFAHDAATLGTRAAFLAHLAPAGIVFANGPVNGIETWTRRANGVSRLAWAPDIAELSAGGDLGWTSGPWWWSPDSASRPQAFGRFFTVWQRDGDTWRAVLDGGIEHDSLPAPRRVRASRLRPVRREAHGMAPAGEEGAVGTLRALEREYGRLAGEAGIAAALTRYADADVRVLRSGHRAFVGLAVARDSIARLERTGAFALRGLHASERGDMGYSYGALLSDGGTPADTSSYVHLWHRRPDGHWALAVEVRIPER